MAKRKRHGIIPNASDSQVDDDGIKFNHVDSECTVNESPYDGDSKDAQKEQIDNSSSSVEQNINEYNVIDSKNEIVELKEELKISFEKYSDLTKTINTLKKTIENYESKINFLDNELKTVNSENSRLVNENNSLMIANSELEFEVARLNSVVNEIKKQIPVKKIVASNREIVYNLPVANKNGIHRQVSNNGYESWN